MGNLKFCKFCGEKIAFDAVICPKCGRQVEALSSHGGNIPIIVNNNNNNNYHSGWSPSPAPIPYQNTTVNVQPTGKGCNKWISLVLCASLGIVGGHKFYEGKIGTGILYCFTGGLFVFGVLIDFFKILNKPNPYYVD